jgi:hypothetical protein
MTEYNYKQRKQTEEYRNAEIWEKWEAEKQAEKWLEDLEEVWPEQKPIQTENSGTGHGNSTSNECEHPNNNKRGKS